MPAKREIEKQHTHHHRDGTISSKSQKPRPAAKPAASPKAIGSPIDGYLARLQKDKRVALEKLRKLIHAAAPGAQECISYQLPAFRLDGKVLVLFGAGPNHCTLFPGSGTAVAAHKDELASYRTSKGAIRFQAEKPLPANLVRKLVKYRIAENARASSAGRG
jgi:uncharacterized protein YdhG (YjbR/CyaY superfamily)